MVIVMKILMLNYEFPPLGGGAANTYYYMLKELAKMDVEIDLVTSSSGKYKEEKFSDKIRIFRLDVDKKDVHYWKMSEIAEWTKEAYKLSKKLVKENNYDLCHCWFGWPCGWIGYKLRKKMPYIVALRGSDVPGYNPRLRVIDNVVFKPLSKKVWKNAKKVIANSSGLRELALKTRKQEINIIPNGVDIHEFKPKYSKNKRLELISTGRLIPRKGYLYLLEAIKGLDVHLTLVGEGNQEEELRRFVKENSLEGKVSFVGVVDHSKIAKFYQNADVFVLPSLNEGMSNSVLEAMACGKPIVVSDTGGTKELVKGNGFVSTGDNLRKSILKYIDNHDLIKVHGRKSREIVEGMSWEKVVGKYLEVYK